MKKNKFFIFTISLMLLLIFQFEILTRDQALIFRVAGHIYPKSEEFFSEENKTNFTVFTGDVIYDGCSDWVTFERNVKDTEHYISPGNHDMHIWCGENFKKLGYSEYFSFYKEDSKFIVLNGNNSWNISGNQLAFLKNELNSDSKNTFIFVHQLIWVDDTDLPGWIPNSFERKAAHTNFQSEVRPLLEQQKNIWLIAGDLGLPSRSFQWVNLNGVNYIAFGLGDSPGSSYADFQVDNNGSVQVIRKVL